MSIRPRALWSASLLAFPTLLGAAALLRAGASSSSADPLPSWNDGAAKHSILAFVQRVTQLGTDDFVPPAERIAVFDDGGTLWVEQPSYVQLAFARDRVRALAPEHPEWKTRPTFQAVLAGDEEKLAALGPAEILALVAETHAGIATEQFTAAVEDWLASARHARFDKRYTELGYQPMLELLTYLRASGFKTFLVSAGSADFLRAFAEEVYGFQPEQVIGSRIGCDYRADAKGGPRLVSLARVELVPDGPAKPVAIQQHVGRRPILAFGNSDADQPLFEWITSGPGPRWIGLVRHTDGAREYEYDRESKLGRLSSALDSAEAAGWTVIDMERDWKRVFAFE